MNELDKKWLVFGLLVVMWGLVMKWSCEASVNTDITSGSTYTVEEVIIPDESTPITTDTVDDGLLIYNIPLSEDLQVYIYRVCAEYKVSVPLVFAIIEVESNFKTDVISSADCYGLMQVSTIHNKKLSKVFGSVDLLNPYENIKAGVYLLSECFDGAESTIHALLRYNNGISGGDSLWADGVRETSYTEKVKAALESYL